MKKKASRQIKTTNGDGGSVLTWENPPTSGRARLKFPEEELRARKGEWGCVAECESQSTAGGRASTFRKSFAEQGFELRSSGNKVYARYVGD